MVVALLLMICQLAYAASPAKEKVNILTWYGYLRSPEIASAIKNECGVEISYDEYHFTNECLWRFNSSVGGFHTYDVIIFPSELYEVFKKSIEIKNSNLSQAAKDYGDHVKKHYLSQDYTNNVVYFTLPFTGFIYDPKNIKISATDTIDMMFAKAKSNLVVLYCSYPAIRMLFDNDKKLPLSLFVKHFRETMQGAYIYTLNGHIELYDNDRFAFAYQRSGEAISAIKFSKNRSLSFFVHPKHSYIIPDLLAELNTKPKTQCVARVLASKKVSNIVQKEMYYLSPYEKRASLNDLVFQSVYKPLFDNANKIQWSDLSFVASASEYSEVRKVLHKILLLPRINPGYGNDPLQKK